MRSPPDPNAADGSTYIEPAENLAHGRGFVAAAPLAASVHHTPVRSTAPDTLRTPGYPLLLATALVLGLPLAAIVALQHLLAAGMTLVVFLVTERMTGRWTGAFAAAMLLALFPPLIGTTLPYMGTTHEYMTDVVGAAVILAAMLAAWKAAQGMTGWAVAAGLLSGTATLVRPIALLWFLPLAIVIATRARRAAVAFTIAAVLLPGAWIARNERATGVATISSIGGENLLFFRASGALVVADSPPGFGFFALQRQSGFFRNADAWKARLARQAYAEMRRDGLEPLRLPHAVLAQHYAHLAARILLSHIPETIELACSALIEIFIGPFLYPLGDFGIVIGLFVFTVVCIGFWRLERTFRILSIVTICYFSLMAAGPEAEIRFAIAFAPAYAIAFGAGITGISEYIVRRAREARAPAHPTRSLAPEAGWPGRAPGHDPSLSASTAAA
jgi:4-amino-4-deoxy-L-arabinose transferase-like glycosyltransferase